MTILFPQSQEWDESRELVWFLAEVDSQHIRCAVSAEALVDHFGGAGIKKLDAFRANRKVIQEVAERLINRKRMEKDGTLLIRSQDF